MQRTAVDTDACVLLAGLASVLADGGPAALPTALDELVRALGLRSAVLRDVGRGGHLVAVAGDVVHAVPRTRLLEPVPSPESVVALPVQVAGRRVRTLTVVGARPAQLPALRACAAVIALALSARPPATPALTLQQADDDADQLADALHDGPVQDLVAARYAADAAVHGGDPASTRDAVQTALVSFRRALWMLRPRGAVGLVPALTALSAQLVEAGRPALALALDELACADLPPSAASLCYRLVQAVASPAGARPAAVTVRRDGARLVLDVEAEAPLSTADRWSVRARAVGADLHVPGPSGPGLRLTLPIPAPLEKK